ncbi:MAG: hypothetical protein J6S61_01080 [Elusimicrobiaceae bacterium]|nr:hypothetical protein [Elusimicrobiaceae bacterium]
MGANWPADWSCDDDVPCGDCVLCFKNPWYCEGENTDGVVYCQYTIDDDNEFYIVMYPPDGGINFEYLRDMTTCEAYGEKAEKVCKALGGQLLELEIPDSGGFCSDCVDSTYKLN